MDDGCTQRIADCSTLDQVFSAFLIYDIHTSRIRKHMKV